VWTARWLVHLPYFWAAMDVRSDGDAVSYTSRRLGSSATLSFRGTYRPVGPVHEAAPGTLEHFLTERYCLYSRSGQGEIFRLEIHHPPWPLQVAAAEFETNALAAFTPSAERPLLHFSRRQDVVGWALARVRTHSG
jgi:uncharacterized protein YqjF (DUF2071 family)